MSPSKVDPPTAQTDHNEDLKFGMKSHLAPYCGAIEAILISGSKAGIWGRDGGTPGGQICQFFSIFFIFLTWLLISVSLAPE